MAEQHKKKAETVQTQLKKTDKRWKKITFTTVSIIFVFIMLLIGHFLYRGCHTTPLATHSLTVKQPSSGQWELTVNDKTGTFQVKEMDDLNIKVTSKTETPVPPAPVINDETCYYVQVAKTGELDQPIYTNELSFTAESSSYTCKFPYVSQWNFDITIAITTSADYENSIYSVDQGGTIDYIFDKSTIYNTSLGYITKIDAYTLTSVNIPRKEFGRVDETVTERKVSNLHIGKKIQKLYEGFLKGCVSFNKDIVFYDDGLLDTIDSDFLYDCQKYDKELKLPTTLKTINGDFMYLCGSFNNGTGSTLSFDNIDLSNCTSFLMQATLLNKPVVLGSHITTIPTFFLAYCTSFNNNFEIPSTVTSVGQGFLLECDSMVSTLTVNCLESAFNKIAQGSLYVCSTENKDAKCYTTGITVNGDRASEWKNHFPNLPSLSVTTFYRNLI